jgi:GAF domain-containing protein/HAMP domain-containing protein
VLLGIRWGSLRAKIIAWTLVPTSIILAVVAVVVFSAYQDVTEDLILERKEETARLTAGEFGRQLDGFADLLDREARTAGLSVSDPVVQRDGLKAASKRLAFFDAGVLILDALGRVVTTEPERAEIVGQRWSDRPYYLGMVDAEKDDAAKPIFSDIVTDGPGGSPVIVVAVPLTDHQGQFQGLVAGMFRVSTMGASALYGGLELGSGESHSAYVVDGQGLVVYHTDPVRIGDDLSAHEVVREVLKGAAGAVRTRDVEDQDVVSSFAAVPGTSWGYVSHESWSRLRGASQRYQGPLLLLLALGVVVPAFVVAIGVGRLTKPIAELVNATREVAAGDFGQLVQAQTGDEIEDLADQFNLMSARLDESYTNLERIVGDRTRELAALNAIAAVVSQSLELGEVLNAALDKTLEVMDMETGGIYLLDQDAGVLMIAAQRGLSQELVTDMDRLKVGEGLSGRVMQSGQPLVVKDVSADPRLTRMLVREAGLGSVAIVPLSSKGKVLGTLFSITYGYREFGDQEIQLLTSIGHQIGVAVDSARLFQVEQRRAEQFRVMAEVGRRITSILDIDTVLVQVVKLIQRAFGYDHVGIALVEGDEAVYQVGAGHLWEDPQFQFEPSRLNVGENGITGWVAGSGKALLVPDVSQEPRYVWMRGSNTRSELAVPITHKGRVMGVLDAQSDQVNAFDDSDLALLQSLANQTAVAIENARLFRAEQRRAEEFRVISEVGRRITSILAVDELLEQMTRLVQESFGYYLVEIGMIEKDELVFQTRAARDGESEFEVFRLKVDAQSITGWVAARGKSLMVPDVSQEPRYVQVTETETRSELAVPIKAKETVLGVINVESDRVDAFRESDVAVLQSLANQAAIAIENARLFRAEQRRAEQFRVISEMGRHITSILAVDELLGQMARLIQQAFNYYHVGIGLLEGDEVVSKAEIGASEGAYGSVRLQAGQGGVWGWVAQSGVPLLVPNVSQEPRFQFVAEAAEIRSQVCVPLKAKEAVIGVLSAESDQVDAFDESDLAVLQSLANQAAIAIENARLFRDAERQVRELRALADASRIISSTLNRDELLRALYEQIRRIAPTDYYLVALYEEETNVVSIEINVDEGVHYPKEQYVLDKGLLKLVIHGRQPLRFDSLTEEKHRLDVDIVPAGSPKVNHGWLGVPMLYGERVLGAIVVGSYRRGVFDERHEQTLTSIASQAAVALENARLYEQSQQLAVMEERQRLARELHDAVTQTLFSASLIAETLPPLWESDQEEGRQLLRELRQLSRGALAEMRTLLLELRPAALMEANLGELLKQLGEAVTGRTGVPVQVSVEGPCRLPTEVHVAFYRIAQEALNNVVKHAEACEVEVSLRCTAASRYEDRKRPKEATLRVGDDGCGFDLAQVPADRLGLGIIRERAQAIGATIEIESQPGQGTRVTVAWREGE